MVQNLRAKAQERKEEQPRPKAKKLERIPLRERLRGRIQSRKIGQELRSAEHRATLIRVAICRAGSSSTLGHASLARRRLVFDCFQGLQNFLPARGAGLSGVAFAQARRLETESRKGWGNRVCEEPTLPT